jgi:hypothetical protein
VDSCLPKDVAGNFLAEQEKSDVANDLLAYLAERMLEMNKQKLAGRSKHPLDGRRATWGRKWRPSRPRPNCRATTSTIMRASWRCQKKNKKKLAN